MDQQQQSQIEELIFNRSFREWVLQKSSADSDYWNKWAAAHPNSLDNFNYAKAIIYALQINDDSLSNDEVNRQLQAILSKTIGLDNSVLADNTPSNLPIIKPLYQQLYFKVACAAILLLAAGLIVYSKYASQSGDYFQAYTLKLGQAAEVIANDGQAIKTCILPDGSKVYLQPHSKLACNKLFSGANREVYLSGSAFFEITKNKHKPFFVYTKRIVTKVLGTSFNVDAFPDNLQPTVVVKTGKVSVFKTENITSANKSTVDFDGIVVKPNQQVVLTANTSQLKKKLIDKPAIVNPNLQNPTYKFDDTPVSQVFKVLQKSYGIDIVYDEDAIAGCSLSATMGQESFYKKIDLVCQAIGATYVIIDGNIVVTSQGCK